MRFEDETTEGEAFTLPFRLPFLGQAPALGLVQFRTFQ